MWFAETYIAFGNSADWIGLLCIVTHLVSSMLANIRKKELRLTYLNWLAV